MHGEKLICTMINDEVRVNDIKRGGEKYKEFICKF